MEVSSWVYSNSIAVGVGIVITVSFLISTWRSNRLRVSGGITEDIECEFCGKKEDLNACSGCLHRKYCSKECRAKARPDHQLICEAYQAIGRNVTNPDKVARGLLGYAGQLGYSNLCESQLRVLTEALAVCNAFKVKRDLTLPVMYNLSLTLEGMARLEEAEVFAREMVAESDKVARIDGMHAMSAERLSTVLKLRGKFEEARIMAHEATERFGPVVTKTDINAAMRLLEAEASALRCQNRHQEALDIAQECLTVRKAHPGWFPDGAWSCFHSVAVSLISVGRLDEAESTLKQAQAMLQSNGIEYHPDVVHIASTLGDVYRLQGRKQKANDMVKTVKKLVPLVFPKGHPDYKMFMAKA
jgi:tetratricopeptide (TPR) repeat protein